jgi:hypothetical protein
MGAFEDLKQIQKEFVEAADDDELMECLDRLIEVGDSLECGEEEDVSGAIIEISKIIKEFITKIPYDGIETVGSELLRLASTIEDEGDEAFEALNGVFEIIKQTYKNIFIIPNIGHCMWFGGGGGADINFSDIPVGYLINMALYAKNHPGGELYLWTDNVPEVEKSISKLMESIRYFSSEDARLVELVSILKDSPLSVTEFMSFWDGSQNRVIKLEPWEEVFSGRWDAISTEDRDTLISSINNEIHGAAPYRYPASGKDIFMTCAVARKGGVGFDSDVVFHRPIRIFDPVGLQVLGDGRPAMVAATRQSELAIEAVKDLAEFLRSIDRFGDKRDPERPPVGKVWDSRRQELVLDLADVTSQALAARYESGIAGKLPAAFGALAEYEKSGAFFIPEGEFADVTIDRARLRRASEPPRSRPAPMSALLPWIASATGANIPSDQES